MQPDPAALSAMFDRLAIEEVINRYFFAVDVGDIDLVVSCFTDDAWVRLMDGNSVMHGRDEVRAAFTERRGTAQLALQQVTGKSHVVGNTRVEVVGDHATATTVTVAYLAGTSAGRPVLLQRGITYVDQLVRHAGGWLISDRVHSTRWHHESFAPPEPGPTSNP